MKPSLLLEAHREAIRAAPARHRMANPRVFGSVMRGDDREDSDLDLLVDIFSDTSILDMGGLKDDLETLLGVKVDILTADAIPERLRTRILSEAVPVLATWPAVLSGCASWRSTPWGMSWHGPSGLLGRRRQAGRGDHVPGRHRRGGGAHHRPACGFRAASSGNPLAPDPGHAELDRP